MKVRYTDTSLRELDEIFAYIAKNNRAAAASVLSRVETLIGQLAEYPLMAQETDIAGVRKFPLGRYPYVIYYTVEDDESSFFTFGTERGGRRRCHDTRHEKHHEKRHEKHHDEQPRRWQFRRRVAPLRGAR